MPIEAFLKKGSLKWAVFEVLGEEWPLTAREIYARVRKRRQVTYQAVFKVLKELLAQKVVVLVDGKNYHLNPGWLEEVEKLGGSLKGDYSHPKPSQGTCALSNKWVIKGSGPVVDSIPCVPISRSTMKDIIHLMSPEELDVLAKKIAVKDLDFVVEKVGANYDIESILERMNGLVTDFFWGRIEYSVENDTVLLKVFSDLFTSRKEKDFYDSIYCYFMKELGYELSKKNELNQSFVFKKLK